MLKSHIICIWWAGLKLPHLKAKVVLAFDIKLKTKSYR